MVQLKPSILLLFLILIALGSLLYLAVYMLGNGHYSIYRVFAPSTRSGIVLGGPGGGGHQHSIAIVTVVTSAYDWHHKFELGISTQRCYAGVQRYPYHLLSMERHDNENEPYGSEWEVAMINKCMGSLPMGFMFYRLCAVAEFLDVHPEHDYVLYLDADIGVINPHRRVEEFIDDDMELEQEQADLIFYDRAFNHEIMSGAIFLKNNERTRRFLLYWSNYTYVMAGKTSRARGNYSLMNEYLPAMVYEQGALHFILMELFVPDQNETARCEELYYHTTTKDPIGWPYHSSIACARHYLSEHITKRVANGAYYHDRGSGLRVKVLSKFMGPARDGTELITEVWSVDSDFMLHGWKASLSDIPKENRDPGLIYYYWTTPFVGEEPFNSEQCSLLPREEVIRRYWTERWRTELMVSKEELEAIFEARKRTAQAWYESGLTEAMQWRETMKGRMETQEPPATSTP